MLRSRRLLSVAAFAALAAWAHAQALACCEPSGPEVSASTEAQASAAPMAADHSCCPGGAAGTDSEKTPAAAGCGMDAGASAICCPAGTAAAVSAARTGPAVPEAPLGTILSTEDPFAAVSAPESPSLPVSFSLRDASPPFLSFQRLLI